MMSHARRMGREPSKPITITVHSDTAMSFSSCAAIVEDVIKYVLYQRGQIPVTLDALVREVRLRRQALDTPHEPEAHTTMDPASRKKELMMQKLRRKWQQWLNKVDKFLQNYNTMKESLCHELESGHVRSVCIILGTSVMTGKEYYLIRLPEGCTTRPTPHLTKAQNLRMKLFRTIVTNEALLKVMNRPCGVQRMWVMVQKSCSPSPDNTSVLLPDAAPNNLISRPDFSQNSRATLVEINVQHTGVTASMDLTPTVGCGIKFQNNIYNKNGINKSLYQNSPSMFHFVPSTSNQDTIHCSKPVSKEHSTVPISEVNDTGRNSFLPPSLSDNSETLTRPILETPVKMSKGEVTPVVETPVHSSVPLLEPVTPSKQLASQLGTFDLCDDVQDTVWYQVDCLIAGFRDMCVRP